MWFAFRLFLTAVRLLPRSRRDLVLENLALRHQLAVYTRARRRAPVGHENSIRPRSNAEQASSDQSDLGLSSHDTGIAKVHAHRFRHTFATWAQGLVGKV